MRWLPTTIRIGWYRSYRSSACWLAFASRRSLAGFLTFRGEIERGLGPPRRGFHRRFPLFKQGSRFDSSFDESIKEVPIPIIKARTGLDDSISKRDSFLILVGASDYAW